MKLDIGFVKRPKYSHRDELKIYRTRAPGAKAILAMALMEKMVLAGSWLSPADLVERACAIADLGIEKLEKDDWLLEVPPPPDDITTPEQMAADADQQDNVE